MQWKQSSKVMHFIVAVWGLNQNKAVKHCILSLQLKQMSEINHFKFSMETNQFKVAIETKQWS